MKLVIISCLISCYFHHSEAFPSRIKRQLTAGTSTDQDGKSWNNGNRDLIPKPSYPLVNVPRTDPYNPNKASPQSDQFPPHVINQNYYPKKNNYDVPHSLLLQPTQASNADQPNPAVNGVLPQSNSALNADQPNPAVNGLPPQPNSAYDQGENALHDEGQPGNSRGNLPAKNSPVAFDNNIETPSSGHFITYFVMAVIFVVVGYLVYHNKQKILGLVIEGRGKQNGRRRTDAGEYQKLATDQEV